MAMIIFVTSSPATKILPVGGVRLDPQRIDDMVPQTPHHTQRRS